MAILGHFRHRVHPPCSSAAAGPGLWVAGSGRSACASRDCVAGVRVRYVWRMASKRAQTLCKLFSSEHYHTALFRQMYVLAA
eukprot:scaffold31254_cov124-Isochrysis_galbana.AAC.1